MRKATNINRSQLFFNDLVRQGLLFPGSVISKKHVEGMLSLHKKPCMTDKDWTNYTLGMLGPIGFTRDELLHYGLYFGQHNGEYRVMLKSDTLKAVKGYIRKAKNACGRAVVLNRNLPVECNGSQKKRNSSLLVVYNELNRLSAS